MRSSVLEAHSEIEILSDLLVLVFAFLGRHVGDDSRRLQDTLTMERFYETSPTSQMQRTRR